MRAFAVPGSLGICPQSLRPLPGSDLCRLSWPFGGGQARWGRKQPPKIRDGQDIFIVLRLGYLQFSTILVIIGTLRGGFIPDLRFRIFPLSHDLGDRRGRLK